MTDLERFDEIELSLQEQLALAPDRFYKIKACMSLSLLYKEKAQKYDDDSTAALAVQYAKNATDLACEPTDFSCSTRHPYSTISS